MDDPEALRQRGLDDAAEVEEMLAQRQREREQRLHAPQGSAGEPEWTPPTLGPAQPVRRAPEPRQRRAPAPPVPNRIVHPRHDSSGRIVEAAHYEGDRASATRSWENFVYSAIQQRIVAFASEFGGGIGEELATINKAEREATAVHVAALEARIAKLEERLAGSRPEEFRHAAD